MLQIPRVQKEDAGKYTCQAVNEAGEDRMHFELEVLGKITNKSAGEYLILHNFSGQVQCILEDNLDVGWKFHDVSLRLLPSPSTSFHHGLGGIHGGDDGGA